MTEQEQMVLAAMESAGKPVRPGEVAEKTGIDKNEVSKIIKALKAAGKVESPKRCFWAPVK